MTGCLPHLSFRIADLAVPIRPSGGRNNQHPKESPLSNVVLQLHISLHLTSSPKYRASDVLPTIHSLQRTRSSPLFHLLLPSTTSAQIVLDIAMGRVQGNPRPTCNCALNRNSTGNQTHVLGLLILLLIGTAGLLLLLRVLVGVVLLTDGCYGITDVRILRCW
jgi:hypothetical protein